jgi:hypothetical protein
MPDPTPAEPVPVPAPPDQAPVTTPEPTAELKPDPAPMPAPAPALEPAPPGKPDAILCPHHYPPGLVGDPRHQKLREEFCRVLGVKLIYSRGADIGHTQTFITGVPNDARGRGIARFFATGHPLQGRDRYDWADRGDGVLYGTLTPEAIEDERA